MPASLLLLFAALATLAYTIWHFFKQQADRLSAERKRLREENQIKLTQLVLSKISAMKSAVDTFSRFLDYSGGYFTNSKLIDWKKENTILFNDVSAISLNDLVLEHDDLSLLGQFINVYKEADTKREQFNKEIIQLDLENYRKVFDNISGVSLDLQQRTAIVKDEDTNLVIAGAGSGKTTTIVGKVRYVVDRYKIAPEDILLISFTRKSAESLRSKIGFPDIVGRTFHRFGMDVITEVEGKQPSVFDENQFLKITLGFFNDCLNEKGYLGLVTEYFTELIKPIKDEEGFSNKGEYIQQLKDQDFRPYKQVLHNGTTTYRRERVKSVEECLIANFLYFNGIAYEYESAFPHETADKAYRQYKPDFTITQSGITIYLEHFAIGKNGKVPSFFADKSNDETVEDATAKYKAGMEWKRQLHATYNTNLIETYSHQKFDGTLLDNLEQSLKRFGVKLSPMPPEGIWKIISESAKEDVQGLVNLFMTFITLLKSHNYSFDQVHNASSKLTDKISKRRNEAFLKLIKPLYERYEKFLSERNEIDFSDMINKATDYVKTKKYKKVFKYIIVDEFQDISIGRYHFIKSLLDNNKGSKLFCVGDDWQSIFRFAGSDIALFKDFEKYFGFTEISKIEATYRFHEPLISLSTNFILKNKNQIGKQLRSIDEKKSTKLKIVYSDKETGNIGEAIKEIFSEILSIPEAKGKKIIILGRYNFDIDKLGEVTGLTFNKNDGSIRFNFSSPARESEALNAEFLTVHKSKGLEADFVIVINCNAGKRGFPSEMADDPVLNLVLSDADRFENGEERRLFYVALSRAREKVFLLSEPNQKSKFIAELEAENVDSTIKKCPRCTTSDLVKRSGNKNGKAWAFYGCANYSYGCDYKEWV